MKLCYTCREEKDLSEFNRSKARADGYNSICRVCSNARSKRYYKENREKHLGVISRQRAKGREARHEFIVEYLLEHPCAECGEPDPVVLEFDHLGDKEMEISTAVHQGWGWSRLKKEIAKCQVLCSNCHKRKTAYTQENYKVKILRNTGP